METELISKKELLELTDISYGQLYRWKRKMLIPEDWFIRKSTFTGQETFFPREKILDRIGKIKNMKEGASLDELAEILSPNPSDLQIQRQDLLDKDIVSPVALDLYEQSFGKKTTCSFTNVLYMYLLDSLLRSGEISAEEGKIIINILDDHFASFQNGQCELIFIRKLGVSACLLSTIPNQIVFDNGTKIVTQLNIADTTEEFKTKLVNKGVTDGKTSEE
ncbi:MAG TPA: YhbD family protein [Balneolales bacterium]|nr:YhbD family protein [Balneolales bacterium]